MLEKFRTMKKVIHLIPIITILEEDTIIKKIKTLG